MRTLTFFFLFATAAHAAPPSASFHSTVKSESGSTGLTNNTGSQSSTYTSSLDLDSGSALSSLSVRAGLDRTQADYDRYVITDRQGTQTLLSDRFHAPEHTVKAGLSYYFGQSNFAADYSHTAGETPFPGYTAKLKAEHALYASGTKLDITLQRSRHEQPLSYFIDPETFSTRLKPTRSLENRAQLGVEQILTETAKARFSLLVVEMPGSRPLRRGAEASLAKALSDSTAIVGTLGFAGEKKSDPLFDDQGYFGGQWGDLELRLEPSYHWELSAKLSTILETETARGRVPRRRVGTDSLRLTALSHWKFGGLGFNAAGARSNTGYRSFELGGNFTWNL